MVWCKKDVSPLLTHWNYVFLALTHQYHLHQQWTKENERITSDFDTTHSPHPWALGFLLYFGWNLYLYQAEISGYRCEKYPVSDMNVYQWHSYPGPYLLLWQWTYSDSDSDSDSEHLLTIISSWISNYMPNKLWGEICSPFPNFSSWTIDIWEFHPTLSNGCNYFACWC